MCNIMNKLQSQPFKINSDFLRMIMDPEYEDKFTREGLFLPRFLDRFDINSIKKDLRNLHSKDEDIQEIISYSELLSFLAKLIQQCSFEGFILRLAKAYDGYNIDFPTFLDFRGRVYRSGIFHFHQCDFARSLILFGGEIEQCSDRYKLQDKLRIPAAFFSLLIPIN